MDETGLLQFFKNAAQRHTGRVLPLKRGEY
jgi:hypothetical protein